MKPLIKDTIEFPPSKDTVMVPSTYFCIPTIHFNLYWTASLKKTLEVPLYFAGTLRLYYQLADSVSMYSRLRIYKSYGRVHVFFSYCFH